MADEEDDEFENKGGDIGFVDLHVSSSCFSSLEYNPRTEQMRMTFVKGNQKVYIIEGIQEVDVDSWVRSMSVGGHFNSFIRGNFA
jgi:hypothetical protein